MPQRSDGTEMSNPDAFAVWAPIARDVLLTTAKSYHALVTYKEVSAAVQEESGISTSQQLNYWIGDVLELVARDAQERDEPPITSLCVHQDGTIGDGYVTAPRSIPLTEGLDADDRAAVDRLACYRVFATDLPADGGVPALTPQIAERRARVLRGLPRLREVTCTACWTIVPEAAVCANCGAPLPEA